MITTNLPAPPPPRNPDDHIATLLDRITDNDFGDGDKTIDQILAPFSTLQRGRGERANERAS